MTIPQFIFFFAGGVIGGIGVGAALATHFLTRQRVPGFARWRTGADIPPPPAPPTWADSKSNHFPAPATVAGQLKTNQ